MPVHHSAQAMDWMAGSRMHLFEIVALRGFTVIPMYALGYEETALKAYILYVFLHSTMLHANVRFDFGFLRHVIATPQFHHWHHGIDKEAIDVNFARALPAARQAVRHASPAGQGLAERLWRRRPSGAGRVLETSSCIR